ncbi:MAG TPA: hypothetical protein VI338_00310 [Nitrososphaera sp.]|nr:hypothetical protein [Nitrososphaera sp.]
MELVKYCDLHAKDHGKRFNFKPTEPTVPNFKATDASMEKVAKFLSRGNVSTADEIAKVISVEPVIVALALHELTRRRIVGVTPHNPHKFFFNP